MAKPHTRPGVLWKLLGTALALEVQDDAAEAAEVEGSVEGSSSQIRHRGSSSSLSEGEWSESRVAAAASSLLRWERPELLFAYLGKRVLTDLLCMHSWPRISFACTGSPLTATDGSSVSDAAMHKANAEQYVSASAAPYSEGASEVVRLARRWLVALLGLGPESMHALRCHARENAHHFEWLEQVLE